MTVLVGLVLTASIPLAASANLPHRPDKSVTVSFADLDVTAYEGRQALYHRLEKAAEKVCGPTSIQLTGKMSRVNSNRSCVRETIARTIEKLDIPNLQAVHRQ
ncbi:MAG: UrcA family protein [Pseudomonadales bacterium]|nr:UrcA family protein [Pseudomonadales bacterium]